jgi:uncharacterized protein (TIGR03118 family)
VTKPAAFIFATESGSIVGWNMDVPPGMSPSKQSEVVKTIPNAVYKGIAMGVMNGKSFLYATNFHQGTVDVFDDNFMPVSMPMNAFKDPALPHGYAPFDIANIGGKFYVTYARQDADAHDDAAAPHRGYIDVYDMFGNLQRRFATRGPLNSPWGLALAPAGFGRFAGALIVGNFGDGHAMAYSPGSGRFLGYLRDATGTALHIDGLWGLQFGNGVAGSTKTLIFSAGPDHEMHGLLGTITGG